MDNITVPPFMNVTFTPVGNLMGVTAEVDGREGIFLLDSGAPCLVLNSRYFATETRQTLGSMGVGGRISGTDIITVKSFKWQQFEKVHIDVMTMDIAHLEEALETEILGLIGFEELEHFELHLDYKSKNLLLFGLDKEGETVAEIRMNSPRKVLKFELQKHIPVFNCKVGNRSLQLGLDTGAESNLLNLVHWEEIHEMLTDTVMEDLSGADKSSQKVQKGVLPELFVDGVLFEDQVTVFSDISHLNSGYELALDGLIGYPFLSTQRTAINFRTQELKLW